MKVIKTILDWALGLWSVHMALNGLTIFGQTSGTVQGSEFGMLITLARQISLVMVWLALFALRSLLPSSGQTAEQSTPRRDIE